MKKAKYKLSSYNLLQEQEDTDYRQQSSITKSDISREKDGKVDNEKRREYRSKSTGLQTGQTVEINQVQGSFGNGISYSTMNNKIVFGDGKKASSKLLRIGKGTESIAVGLNRHSETGKLSFHVHTDNKIEENPFKVLGHIISMGITPKEFIQVVKKINKDIDTSELESEAKKINEAQLSRGSLYRRRYHGRY